MSTRNNRAENLLRKDIPVLIDPNTTDDTFINTVDAGMSQSLDPYSYLHGAYVAVVGSPRLSALAPTPTEALRYDTLRARHRELLINLANGMSIPTNEIHGLFDTGEIPTTTYNACHKILTQHMNHALITAPIVNNGAYVKHHMVAAIAEDHMRTVTNKHYARWMNFSIWSAGLGDQKPESYEAVIDLIKTLTDDELRSATKAPPYIDGELLRLALDDDAARAWGRY